MSRTEDRVAGGWTSKDQVPAHLTERIMGLHLHAARVYLYGQPGTPSGNWTAACKAAGFAGKSASLDASSSQAALQVIREIRDALLSLEADADMADLQNQMAAGSTDWAAQAAIAQRIMGKVAAGTREASSSQMAALKEVLIRGQGKAGTGGEAKEAPPPVVVLPTVLNEDRALTVELPMDLGEAEAEEEAWVG